MNMPFHPVQVPLFDDGQGGLRVTGTRVLLERIIHAFEDGATPEGIVHSYDTLDLADVYAVLTWYLRNKAEVQAYLLRRAEAAEAIRKTIEAKQPSRAELRARLDGAPSLRRKRFMLHLVSDENFSGDIVRGLMRRHPGIDLVRVQDAGLMQTPDPEILEWAAKEGRVLLSHDISSVPPAAFQRVGAGKPMPGVFVVPDRMPIGAAIEEILFLSSDVASDEWKDQVLFLPV